MFTIINEIPAVHFISGDPVVIILLAIISICSLFGLFMTFQYKRFHTHLNNIRVELARLKLYESVKFPKIKRWPYRSLMSDIEDLSISLQADKEKSRRHEQQNILLAKIDKEMSIPNRGYFMDLIKNHEEQKGNALLISINFTNLIKLFTIKGMPFSNKMLSDSIARILELSHTGSFIGRMSTSHFMLYVPINQDWTEEGIVELALTIQSEIEKAHSLDESNDYLHASLGIAYRNDQSSKTLVDLVHLAELAIIEKRTLVGKSIYMSHSALQSEESDKYQMEIALREALFKKEFSVVYQPIVSLTDSAVSLETLVRWKHKGKWVSPVIFIPMIEDIGLIGQLTKIVVDKIIADYDFWKKEYAELSYISINISPRMLEEVDTSFLTYVNKRIKAKEIPQHRICFEITENEVLNESTLTFIQESKEQGFLIAIDDFGTGYTSMAYIANYSFNILKVDRSFVKTLEENNKQREVALAIIQLAKRLNIKVVAEGVETEGQLDILKEMGTDAIQGYYYSKPQFIDEWIPFRLNEDKKVIHA